MKKYLKIVSFILLTSIIISSTHYSIYAKDSEIDTSIMGSKFVEDLNPDGLDGPAETLSTPIVNFIKNVINPILGFVQIIGGILTVISIALFGFGMLLSGNGHLADEVGLAGFRGGPHGGKGGPDARHDLLMFGRTMVIGSVLLFFSASIVKFVFFIFNI